MTRTELPIQNAEFFHILMECELEVDVDCSVWSRKFGDSCNFRFLCKFPEFCKMSTFLEFRVTLFEFVHHLQNEQDSIRFSLNSVSSSKASRDFVSIFCYNNNPDNNIYDVIKFFTRFLAILLDSSHLLCHHKNIFYD